MDEAFSFLQLGWLNGVREWQEEFVGNMSSREFVPEISYAVVSSSLPQGERIKNLPIGATVIDYSYMIHTDNGNKMVVEKVNGNLVSPTHVLANAEVVEIITYNFLREQAAPSAAEITTDRVNDFIAYSEEDSEMEDLSYSSRQNRPLWEKILRNIVDFSTSGSSEDALTVKNGSIWVPKVNGKHNKQEQDVGSKANGYLFSLGNGAAKMIPANDPPQKEVLPGLESWQASKIASWHNLEGHPIQWFSVVCIDRRGKSFSNCVLVIYTYLVAY
ncbi:putative GTP diphosphokinase RSH1, chloroplastic isoform X1 [Gossypium arboreum]|uniref:putative GTP diphosphokinase RSH1, chloroplastic isoform X1 n=1 Tax=Gossypium arboreum TaxID=29729 RepID=UPI0022F1560B|nr:putative GTP diphosphokinase RSH1, chloroplastic isoform X1 [Gossypium arboreum]